MRSSADDVRMTYTPADNMQMMYSPADDVWMTYVIWQPKSPMKSHSRVICTSSACHLHETSVPRLFQVKQQRTALLKRELANILFCINQYLLLCTTRLLSIFSDLFFLVFFLSFWGDVGFFVQPFWEWSTAIGWPWMHAALCSSQWLG